MKTIVKIPEKPQQNYDEMSQKELAKICHDQAKVIADLSQNMNWLMEQVKLMNQKRFGSSSDSVGYPKGYDQICLFNEAEVTAVMGAKEPSVDESIKKPPHKKKEKGKRERDLSNLSVTIIEHQLPEEDRDCPQCGNQLHDMKVEVTKTIKLIPAHMEIEEHHRHVYTCRPCAKNQGEGDKVPFVRAPMPQLPIPGSFATPELIAGIINSKYTNAQPLARVEKEFGRYDVAISRQTMSNWILRCAEDYFSRIYTHMRKTLLAKDVLHADETWVQVVNEPGRNARSKSYIWVYCSGIHDKPIVYYEYHQSRAAESAKEFLKGYTGFLHTDGYDVYHR